MKKKIIFAITVVLLLCGCEKTIPKLENGKEAVVTFEKIDSISTEELYEEMKKSYATEIIADMVDKRMLEDKYSKSLDEATKYAEDSLKTAKTYYKDESELLNLLNQYYGISSFDEYKDYLKLNFLRNKVTEDYAESTITESEIEKYYKNEVVGARDISHILIVPEVKDNMTDEEKKTEEDKAFELAKEIIAKLKKGEKFEDLAREYSDDESTKDKGGILEKLNKGTYGSNEFDKEAFSLEVKTYSNVPVKTEQGYEVIYVTKEYDKESLDKVKDTVIKALKDEKLANDATIQLDALKALREEYGVNIIDDEIRVNYNKRMNNLRDQVENGNN